MPLRTISSKTLMPPKNSISFFYFYFLNFNFKVRLSFFFSRTQHSYCLSGFNNNSSTGEYVCTNSRSRMCPDGHFKNLILKTLHENPRAFKNTYWEVPDYFNVLIIDSELFINVLKSIRHRPSVVLGLFRWAEVQKGFKHSEFVFCTVLEILVQNDMMSSAYWVAERAISMNLHCVVDVLIDGYLKYDVSVKLLDLLLWVYSKKSDVKHCLVVFDKMVRSRFLPDVKNCNRVLRILRDRNLVAKAREVYGMMGDIGIEPTIVTYNTMLDLLCKKGEVQQALDLLLEMQRRDFSPNDVTYNLMINGLSKKGEFDRAKELIGVMLNKGLEVSSYTYNPLISGYCQKGMLIEALWLGEEMEIRGALPSISTYNAFMHGFCKLGRVNDAWQWIPVMLKKNLMPDVVTYNTLIYGHCQLGDITKALFLLFEMRRRNVKPTLITYNTMMDGLCKHGDLDSAMRLKDEMISYGIFPDAFSYTILIDGSYKAGNLLMAKKVFDEMVSKGVEPDRLAYTTCITGELKLGYLSGHILQFGTWFMDWHCLPCCITFFLFQVCGLEWCLRIQLMVPGQECVLFGTSMVNLMSGLVSAGSQTY